MQIYLARNTQQAGPYTLTELNNMLASGQVVLTDLAWHEGMENWQPLVELTDGQTYYTGKQLAADSLSGSLAQIPSATTPTDKTANPQQPLISKQIKNKQLKQALAHLILAPVGSRILAAIIDQLLFSLVFVPVFIAIGIEHFNPEKIKTTADYMQLLEQVPQTTLITTVFLSIGLLVIQLFLLAKRGQSLGKLALGIRILDYHSKKIPSALNIIGLRTLLFNFSYNLPFIGLMILIADIALLLFAPENRSLHDKVANTYVVKADNSQLQP